MEFYVPSLETAGEPADLVNLRALLDVIRGDLGRDGLVGGPGKTVHCVVIASRSDVAHLVGKLPVGQTELVILILDSSR